MQAGIYPEVPDDFGHWLAGFIDGEGSFVACPIRSGRNAGAYAVAFRICLREDDRPILEEIRRRTATGTITRHVYKPRNPVAIWAVNSRADLSRLVVLLDRFPLRAKKARDYAIWREAVLYLARSPRTPGIPRNWGPLPEIAASLARVRRFHASGPHPMPKATPQPELFPRIGS